MRKVPKNKGFDYKSIEDAPAIIKFILYSAYTGTPIGSKMLDEAVEKHPEYFPDIVEYRRKRELVPEEVDAEYWSEYNKLHDEIFKDVPPSTGLMSMCNNTDEFQAFNKAYKNADKIFEPLNKELYKKFYSKYGLQYQGI